MSRSGSELLTKYTRAILTSEELGIYPHRHNHGKAIIAAGVHKKTDVTGNHDWSHSAIRQVPPPSPGDLVLLMQRIR